MTSRQDETLAYILLLRRFLEIFLWDLAGGPLGGVKCHKFLKKGNLQLQIKQSRNYSSLPIFIDL